MITKVQLYDPDTGATSVITPRPGVAWQGIAVAGVPRAVTESRVGGDGSIDTTAAYDAAAVSISLNLPYGDRAFLDEIGGFLHPAQRPKLVVSDNGWAQDRQLTLRFDSSTTAVTTGTGLSRALQYSWQAPDGVWEQAGDEIELVIPASVPSTTGAVITGTSPAGLHMASTGLHMPATSRPPEFQSVNPGSMPAPWTGFLYGPCTGPKIADDSAGLAVEFTDALVLAAGEYVFLDPSVPVALLNSDPRSPVMSLLDFATTSWWTLPRGLNLLRYYPSAAQAGAEAAIFYRPRWAPQ